MIYKIPAQLDVPPVTIKCGARKCDTHARYLKQEYKHKLIIFKTYYFIID